MRPVTLRDDAAAGVGKNGKPALAAIYRSLWKTMNDFATRMRPIRSWWGGNDNYAELTTHPQVRGMWLNPAIGAPGMLLHTTQVDIVNALGVPQTGLTTYTSVNGSARTFGATQTSGIRENINELPPTWYPDRCYTGHGVVPANRDYVDDPDTAREFTIRSGNSVGPVYGPQLRSGLVMEQPVSWFRLNVGKEVLPLDGLSTGGDIIGVSGTYRDMATMRDFFNRLWRDKRIHVGYSIANNSATPWVAIGSQPRYIHDTNYGSGGIAPTINGPGWDAPLRYTAHGRETTVRIYVRVYARMAGGGTGTLHVYNRNNSNGMAGPTLLTNAPTISGSTWQWYPNTNLFNGATDPYFLGNANTAYSCDNILLCPAGTGSDIQVQAYTMTVRPSTL